ncbi:DUF4278 domain-containing protein [Nodosilinea nodulosa]|uniref:DUF4278 domain-containing protein n=1 Tax=Nodosilinea nodulosa TaxID=416001 RepID=UPI0008FBB85C|nr:DUF4278 domain-containing protein [Nodosilinea nodulosa]
MRLTYRGNSYETTIPMQTAASNQLKIKLTYRGNSYEYILPLATPAAIESVLETVILCYRGNAYQRQFYRPKPSQNVVLSKFDGGSMAA